MMNKPSLFTPSKQIASDLLSLSRDKYFCMKVGRGCYETLSLDKRYIFTGRASMRKCDLQEKTLIRARVETFGYLTKGQTISHYCQEDSEVQVSF